MMRTLHTGQRMRAHNGPMLPYNIQSAVETTSASGEVFADWEHATLVGTRLGYIEIGKGEELDVNGRIIATEKTRLVLRGGLAITPKMRAVDQVSGALWDIEGVRTVDGSAPASAETIICDIVSGQKQTVPSAGGFGGPTG